MKPRLSLRLRLMLAAALWTMGLFAVAGIVLTRLIFENPHAPRIFHGMFMHGHWTPILAAVCLIAGAWHLGRAVLPISQLRARLGAVHEGREPRVAGTYPAEVQPLVDDLNALLAHHEVMVARAQSRAGDLAHGLKTPLAVLANEASRVEASGHAELAASLQQQIDRMRRQIEYHLAHARAAAGPATPTDRASLVESAEGLARALRRLHADRGLAIDVDVAADHVVRCRREDLDEMLGNLLDNACKWARTRVVVHSTATDGDVVIVVDDDGPGLDPSKRAAVLQRGVRADEAAPGSGLGLAIVRDLADLHHGSIALAASPAGGVRAELRLPQAKGGQT